MYQPQVEKIQELISQLEKEKNGLLNQKEELQFRARIAANRRQEVQNQINQMSAFKADKEADLRLVKLRVETREGQFDDIKAKIMRQGQKILSLDLNGNEAPPEGDAATKHCKSGSPIGKILHGEVGLKTRPVETSIIAKPHPGICHI